MLRKVTHWLRKHKILKYPTLEQTLKKKLKKSGCASYAVEESTLIEVIETIKKMDGVRFRVIDGKTMAHEFYGYQIDIYTDEYLKG